MIYREDKNGNKLSMLGFGCMRFTRNGPKIDMDKAEKEILAAFQAGVNYYDTAYIYGDSEAVIGEIFERNSMRGQISIATKLPQYLISSRGALDRYFNEELSRLRTDYVDYYLMHHLTDAVQWEKLKDLGIEEWIRNKKASGQIRNIGFSYHGNTDNFLKILDGYDWDFCQIQYNYMDEVSQAGVAGLRAAAAKGIPVVIMEPLRGGKLAAVPDNVRKAMQEVHADWSPAEWGFRWLFSQPEVTVVLSGMNSVEMVQENCRIASSAGAGCMGKEELDALDRVRAMIREKEKVGCTGCRYCMPCPKGVDIPGIFRSYNRMYTDSRWSGRFEFAQTAGLTREPAFATQCIGCGKCEQHCPQNLPIREKLKEADRALRPLPVKVGIQIARKFLLRSGKGKKT